MRITDNTLAPALPYWVVCGLACFFAGPYVHELAKPLFDITTTETAVFTSIQSLAAQTRFPLNVLYWYLGLAAYLPFQVAAMLHLYRRNDKTHHNKPPSLLSALAYLLTAFAVGYALAFHIDSLLGLALGSDGGTVTRRLLNNAGLFSLMGSMITYLLPLAISLSWVHFKGWLTRITNTNPD